MAQVSKFRKIKYDNGGDKLAYTISCFRKIISQCLQSQGDSV